MSPQQLIDQAPALWPGRAMAGRAVPRRAVPVPALAGPSRRSLIVAAAAAMAPVSLVAQTAAPKTAACPALLQHTVLRLQDEKPQALCQYAGRVLLVVNTASFCGFTPQYEGLEALHRRYSARGLVVLGFPSNDFSQESGSNQQIADFCQSTFGVQFPMFTKTSVRGAQAAPLFQQLARATGEAPGWNFHKYLVGRDGRALGSYGSRVDPQDRGLVREIERALATN